MAARTLYPNHTGMNISAATWKLTDDLPEGILTKPVAGDTVLFTENSGNVAVDENSTLLVLVQNADGNFAGTFTINNGVALTITESCECESDWVHTGSLDFNGTGPDAFQTFATHTGSGAINVAGGFLLSAGQDFSGYTGTMTWDGAAADSIIEGSAASLPDFVVNGAGTLTLGVDTTFKNLILTGGTFAGSTYAITITGAFLHNGITDFTGSGAMGVIGNITYAAGTNSHTGTWTQTASGNVSWATTTNPIADLVLGGAGVTSTLTNHVHCKKFTHGAGTVALVNKVLYVRDEAGNDFWTGGTGSFTRTTGGVKWVGVTNGRTQQGFTLRGTPLYIWPDAGATITATGDWILDTDQYFYILANTAGAATVDMAGHGLRCGDLILGVGSASNFSGVLKAGEGTLEIASVTNGNAANLANELHFETCNFILSGTMDGTGIVVTSQGAKIHGGTIQNVSSTGPIQGPYSTDGGGNNADVRFYHRRMQRVDHMDICIA